MNGYRICEGKSICEGERVRDWSRAGRPRNKSGVTSKKKSPLDGLPSRGRESSGDLLSRIRGPGTIGDLGLDFRVRDGNGYDPHSITAETISAWNQTLCNHQSIEARRVRAAHADRRTESLKERKSYSRAISTARLNVSPRSHLRPIDVVVSDGPSGGCPRET